MGKPKDDSKIARTLRAEPVRPGQSLMFRPQVMRLVGLNSYTTLYEWMQREIDPFPSPVELGNPGSRSSLIAWYTHEVHGWVATRPRRQFGLHAYVGKRDDAGRPIGSRRKKPGAVDTAPAERRTTKTTTKKSAGRSAQLLT